MRRYPRFSLSVNGAETAARELGLQVQLVALPGENELDDAFCTIAHGKADAAARIFSSGMLYAN